MSGAVPLPTARPLGGLLGSATHVLWVRVCGCGGPTLSPWPACPVGAACRGGGGGPSRGGVACHCCEGRLVSGAVPPPAARPLERAARVPLPVCSGCGRCGRGDPAPAPRRALLQAGVAPRGGGGRASPGGLPSAIVRGVWGQTLPLPRLPALWAGCQGSLATCCGRGCGCVRCVWCLCGAIVARGAAFLLSLWCSPLRCFGAVLCSPCACRAFFRARVPCSAAGYPLLLSWLRCSLPFPLPFSPACTFSLPPLWCVSRSFSLPARRSLLLGPLRQRKDGGMWAFGGWARPSCTILYPRWHHVRCGCVLRCAAYNIPVFALVSTCVRTLLSLRAIPRCACPRR